MNNEIISQLEVLPFMISRTSTANRLFDLNINEKLSTQSMVTEKMGAQKSKQNTGVGFQSQS